LLGLTELSEGIEESEGIEGRDEAEGMEGAEGAEGSDGMDMLPIGLENCARAVVAAQRARAVRAMRLADFMRVSCDVGFFGV
jgi:hypothetical protein